MIGPALLARRNERRGSSRAGRRRAAILRLALPAALLLGAFACGRSEAPAEPAAGSDALVGAGSEYAAGAGSAPPPGGAAGGPLEPAHAGSAALGAAGSRATGAKPVVAVGYVGVAAQNISCEGWERRFGDCNAELAAGFRAMLETAIVRTGKMDVMERLEWDALLAERGFDESGLTDRPAAIGGLTGVDYYVYGAITRFGALGSGVQLPNTTVRRESTETEMGVDLKVAETSTGHIVLAESVRATVTSSSRHEVAGFVRITASADPFADVQAALAAKVAEAVVTSRIRSRSSKWSRTAR